MHVKDPFDSITVITTLQIHILGGRRGCDHMVVGFTTTYDCILYVSSDTGLSLL